MTWLTVSFCSKSDSWVVAAGQSGRNERGQVGDNDCGDDDRTDGRCRSRGLRDDVELSSERRPEQTAEDHASGYADDQADADRGRCLAGDVRIELTASEADRPQHGVVAPL